MQTLILTVHILACLFLISVVLLQAGKEGMGVIFGGGSSTVFGSSGAGGLLVKVTAMVAGIFLITSLTYNIVIKTEHTVETGSVMDVVPEVEPVAPEGVEIEKGADAVPSQGEIKIEEGADQSAAASGEVKIEESAPAEAPAETGKAAPAEDAQPKQ